MRHYFAAHWLLAVHLGFFLHGHGGGALLPAAHAEDVADIAAPVFSVYGTEDGLSDEIWSTVGIDGDGFVWAGSASRVARFDGRRWSLWSSPETHSLVRDMETDEQGNLWAIFESEGLARYDCKHWQLIGDNGALHRFSVVKNALGARQLWVSSDNGVARLRAGRWQKDLGPGLPPGEVVAGIERTETLFGAPREWLATQSGLWFRPADRVDLPWQRSEIKASQQIFGSDLLVTRENGAETLWMVAYGGGVLRIQENDTRHWRAATGELPSEAIYTLEATYDRVGAPVVWISSRGGLIQIRGDEVKTFDRRHGLPSDAIRGIKVQRSNDIDLLWVATESGMARAALTYGRWQSVSLHGARENGVFGLLVENADDGSSRVWAGSASQGLAIFAKGKWQQRLSADGFDLRGIRMVTSLLGPDGDNWRLLSLSNGQLLRIDDRGHFSELATPWPKPRGQAVSGMYAQARSDGAALWFATTQSGVYRLHAGSWQRVRHIRSANSANVSPWAVYRFLESALADGSKQLWALGNTGLARLDGEQFVDVSEQIDLRDGVRGGAMVAMGGRTLMWLASNRSGVIQLDVSQPKQPKVIDQRLPELADPTLYSVLQDRVGRIYLCTNNGVQLLTPRADGSLDSEIFRRRDGLIHDECNTNSQVLDEQDRYWVGTLGGLGRFDPNLQAHAVSQLPKPLRLSGVEIDAHALSWPLAEQLDIPAGAGEVLLRVSLMSGLREPESRFRSQLLGVETQASAWSAVPERRLNSLLPGEYELLVEAKDYAGTESVPLRIKLKVRANWWQLPSMQFLLFVLTLLLSALAVLIYNRQLRRRGAELSKLVAEKTAELHRNNQQLRTLSYVDPLTNVANRRRLTEAMTAAFLRAKQRALPVALIMIDIDHFKHYNDQHGHLAGDAALRAVASALRNTVREQDLVARYGGEEFAVLMLDAPVQSVEQAAERMRALVAALPPNSLGNDVDTLTISAGLLCRIPKAQDSPESFIAAADAALYQAKAQGRNRVVRAS